MNQLSIIKVAGTEPVAAELAETINQKLAAGQTVLWLLSGGSTIPVAIETLRRLSGFESSRLIVGQIDERYGPIGHQDSNWRALTAAGLDEQSITALPILANESIDYTVSSYGSKLTAALASSDYKIGLFGVGADGHTAGILPHSPGAMATEPVVHFSGPDFERITITAAVIKQLDLSVVYAQGKGKQAQLAQLNTDINPSNQPAQLLKLAKQLIVYNDYNEII